MKESIRIIEQTPKQELSPVSPSDKQTALAGLKQWQLDRRLRLFPPEIPLLWKPGFKIEAAFNKTKGPFVEIAGPTENGFALLTGVALDRPIHITNYFGREHLIPEAIRRNLPPELLEEPINPDAYIDMDHMAFRDRSVGLLLGSALNIGYPAAARSFMAEAARVIEPDGYLLLQKTSADNLNYAQEAGLQPVATTIAYAHRPEFYAPVAGDTPKETRYSYSFIFQNPAPPEQRQVS